MTGNLLKLMSNKNIMLLLTALYPCCSNNRKME